jgi:hypothetical protein
MVLIGAERPISVCRQEKRLYHHRSRARQEEELDRDANDVTIAFV